LDARLDAAVDRFIERPRALRLSWEEQNRLRERTELEVLFGLLGALTSTVSTDSGPLTKRRLVDLVDDILTRAMHREADSAADLAPHTADLAHRADNEPDSNDPDRDCAPTLKAGA
jgi:hypothetical protein